MQVVEGDLLIDLQPQTLDDITRQTLIQLRDDFKNDLKRERPLVFYADPVKDKKEIKKHIRAFNLVIDYLK